MSTESANVEFQCRCVDDDDWEMVGWITDYGNEQREGVTIAEYECQTCGEFYDSELDSEQV